MDKQKSAAHQKQLLAMRAALLAQISDQRGSADSRADAAADRFGHHEDSPAQTSTERELEFAISDREAEELAAIDAALNRIEAGTYGACLDCGVQIAAARLDASPEVARCIPCQEKVEQQLSS